MLALKVPIKQAEKWKGYILVNNLMDKDYHYIKEGDYIYFPVKKDFAVIKPKDGSESISFVEKEFTKNELKKSLKDSLSKELTKEEMDFLNTAHDIIGTIAILEIPDSLLAREDLIAQKLLESNKQIKTVLKKAGSHEGVFRTQKMTYLAGVDTKETIYKENGVQLKLNVETVYFSMRLSNERKRIMQLVKKGEEILVMFSGCAPYPIVLSKNTLAKHILGIEINPDGHHYGLLNVQLNKVKNVDLICGDVHLEIPKLLKNNPQLKFNRIIMPLPKTADEFLEDALHVAKKGTIIHFYDFLDPEKVEDALNKIDVACKKHSMKYKILEKIKCGQHAPYIYRMCIDFEIV